MKTFVSISIALITLIATSGVGVTKHYCGKRIASVSVLGDGGCICGDMEDDSDCCHTERNFFQVDDDFSVAPVQSLSVQQVAVLSILAYNISFDLRSDGANINHRLYRPPIPERDIPVLVQSFLI